MQVLQAATGRPVSMEEAKRQCALIDDTHYLLLDGYINAATKSVEVDIGGVLMSRRLRFSFADCEAGGRISIPTYPVTSVDAVFYLGSDGQPVQLQPGDDYTASLDGRYPFVAPVGSWPSEDMNVEVTAGYATADAVPEDIRYVILMRVKEMFAHRGESFVGGPTSTTQMAMNNLLFHHRRLSV